MVALSHVRPLINHTNHNSHVHCSNNGLCDDAPLNSFMGSIVSLKVKTMELKGVGMHSMAHNTSRVEGCAGAPGWGVGRLTSNSITYMNLHKPNHKLISA